MPMTNYIGCKSDDSFSYSNLYSQNKTQKLYNTHTESFLTVLRVWENPERKKENWKLLTLYDIICTYNISKRVKPEYNNSSCGYRVLAMDFWV